MCDKKNHGDRGGYLSAKVSALLAGQSGVVLVTKKRQMSQGKDVSNSRDCICRPTRR